MKKSKFDMVYESIKEDLKKRLCMEDAETKQEDPALEDDMATEEAEENTGNAEETNAATDELANEDDVATEEAEEEADEENAEKAEETEEETAI